MSDASAFSAPRRLLARVRDIMAGGEGAQSRLDQVVSIIATDMVAEVCSVYVRRAGDVLELFATHGLKSEAVHATRLRVGEGLVGDIAAHARPMALADAQSHPSFVYRPETGEEIYHSLMGVPVLRSGRVIGVLVVQNKTTRNYADEEMEALQTVAMVLAEVIASGELIEAAEWVPADGIALKTLRLEGAMFNEGLGIGQAVLHRPEYRVRNLVSDDPEAERERLSAAFRDMFGALDSLFGAEKLSGGGEHRDVLNTYRMIAEDAGWIGRIEEAIAGGLTAEAAVKKVQDDIRARMSQVSDPYLRERIHDFDDLANRLLGHLIGDDANGDDLPDDIILVARNLGPAELLDYDHDRLRGLVMEEGSPTSHVSIVAHALNIPVIGRVRDVMDRLQSGDPIIVDGENAQVFIRPGEDVAQAFEQNLLVREQQKKAYAALRDLPAVTKDGTEIKLQINAGLLVDLAQIEVTGAEGVGLYRTEIPFMVRSEFPDVTEQESFYARVYERVGAEPVTFRTLDIGSDKVLPYWNNEDEENPAMGWRAVRVALDRPYLLRQQIRALLRASKGRELRIMFPMVADITEFDALKKVLDIEVAREQKAGSDLPDPIRVGVMIEVPSIVLQLPDLVKRVDFVSIGSNDLLQFLFASDRGNPRLAGRYDPLSPMVLGYFRTMVDQCRAAGVEIGLCGEMGGRPLDAMALLGLGIQSLSVSPPAIGPVKAMIRSLDLPSLRTLMATFDPASGRSVRELMRCFARDHGVNI